jgi:hypothetical protein
MLSFNPDYEEETFSLNDDQDVTTVVNEFSLRMRSNDYVLEKVFENNSKIQIEDFWSKKISHDTELGKYSSIVVSAYTSIYITNVKKNFKL